MQARSEQDIRERFVYLAQELSTHFPNLDLRFNWQSDTSVVRLLLPSISKRRAIELDLEEYEQNELLWSAIFRIKELAQIFDA